MGESDESDNGDADADGAFDEKEVLPAFEGLVPLEYAPGGETAVSTLSLNQPDPQCQVEGRGRTAINPIGKNTDNLFANSILV